MASFRFLEDIVLADAAFEAWGATPNELFEASAQAVIATMVDPQSVTPAQNRTVEHQDDDLGALLFDWLSDIVYLKDAEGLVFRSATALVSQAPGSRAWHLTGTLTGEPIDPTRHDLRADVKAVTKHLYAVGHEGRPGQERWTARVVLDI